MKKLLLVLRGVGVGLGLLVVSYEIDGIASYLKKQIALEKKIILIMKGDDDGEKVC